MTIRGKHNYPPEVLRLMVLEYERNRHLIREIQDKIEQLEFKLYDAQQFVKFYEEWRQEQNG